MLQVITFNDRPYANRMRVFAAMARSHIMLMEDGNCSLALVPMEKNDRPFDAMVPGCMPCEVDCTVYAAERWDVVQSLRCAGVL
jgi:hypothetical protein